MRGHCRKIMFRCSCLCLSLSRVFSLGLDKIINLPLVDTAAQMLQLPVFDDVRGMLECKVCQTSQLSGVVGDCRIDFGTVDAATEHFFLPVLKELQSLPFFKYFKVDLSKECPFWEDQSQCFMRDCAVCECDPNEIPKNWIAEDTERNKNNMSKKLSNPLQVEKEAACAEQLRKEAACKDTVTLEKELGAVDHSHSDPESEHFNVWKEGNTEADDIWAMQEEGDENFSYVNLELNPEQFTGYTGEAAWKIWRSIYQENCFEGFTGGQSECREKRIFFRLMSGLQGSITTQVANMYMFKDGSWGPNIDLFVMAVGKHSDRLTNLYFAYLFMLRAIAKAAPLLTTYDFDTGNLEQDQRTKQLVGQLTQVSGQKDLVGVADHLIDMPEKAQQCMKGFDETGMFAVSAVHDPLMGTDYAAELAEKEELKRQFVHKFHNISRIMDCVGCEKCRMWGKLEVLGIGTAIKVMLGSELDQRVQHLSRNEVIALINTAAQLGKSVGSVPVWRRREIVTKGAGLAKTMFGTLGLAVGVLFLMWRRRRRSSESITSSDKKLK